MRLSPLGLVALFFLFLVCPHLAFFSLCASFSFWPHCRTAIVVFLYFHCPGIFTKQQSWSAHSFFKHFPSVSLAYSCHTTHQSTSSNFSMMHLLFVWFLLSCILSPPRLNRDTYNDALFVNLPYDLALFLCHYHSKFKVYELGTWYADPHPCPLMLSSRSPGTLSCVSRHLNTVQCHMRTYMIHILKNLAGHPLKGRASMPVRCVWKYIIILIIIIISLGQKLRSYILARWLSFVGEIMSTTSPGITWLRWRGMTETR